MRPWWLQMHVVMEHVRAIVVLATLIVLAPGCAIHYMGNEVFEEVQNRRIGKPIGRLADECEEVKTLSGGRTEYIFERGGKWAIVVDQNGIVESWHYVSEPERCKLDFML